MWSLAKTAAPRAEDALCSPACCWHLCASHAKDEPCQKGLQIHQVPFSSVLKPAGKPPRGTRMHWSNLGGSAEAAHAPCSSPGKPSSCLEPVRAHN